MGAGSRSMVTDPNREAIYETLKQKVLKLLEQHPDLVLISGMAEGWDEAIAKIGMREGIPYHVYLPNKDYGDYYWRRNSKLGRDRLGTFKLLVSNADKIITVCNDIYVDGIHSNFHRNDAMVAAADEALIYNPGSSGTKHAVASLKKAKVPMQTYPFDTLL